MATLKEIIAAKTKPRVVDVPFTFEGDPEPTTLRFRALKYPERKAIITSKFTKSTDEHGKSSFSIPQGSIGDLNAEFLAASLVDEEDKPMFTKDDVIKNWDSNTADKMTNAGMAKLGMTDAKAKPEDGENEENPSTGKSESGEP